MSEKTYLHISIFCFVTIIVLVVIGSFFNTDYPANHRYYSTSSYSSSNSYSSYNSYEDRASEEYYRSIGFSEENAKRAVETEKVLDYLMSND